MVEVTTCPLCGKNDTTPHLTAYDASHPMTLIVEDVPMLTCIVTPYVECTGCGMVWQTPRMDDTELERYYSSGLYRRLLHQPQEALDKDELARSQRIYTTLQTLHPHPHSVLDIGCSRGYLLQMYAKEGVDVIMGVEQNRSYVLPDVPSVGGLSDVPHTYAVVTLLHVLEHVPNPVEYLREVSKYVERGGSLLIEIPSKDSKGGPYRLAHLSYMKPEVIAEVCKAAGLTVVSVKTEEHTQVLCTV